MTLFETKQPHETFFRAGERGFLIGVYVNDNPYKLEPASSLWLKGWRTAKKRFDLSKGVREASTSVTPAKPAYRNARSRPPAGRRVGREA